MPEQQSNDFGFIPDPQSDFPFAIYVDWAVLSAVLVGAVGVFIWLRRRRSRR